MSESNREIKFTACYHGRIWFVFTRKPKIIRGKNYKGWYKENGYIERLVTEHPFANSRGYVAEHRLVMEEHLGRFLEPTEKIHHRDQNRENNNIDNLELFGSQSAHAKIKDKSIRNKHGQFVCDDPIFSQLKYRLYNKDTKTTYIYTLATLIGTTFRRGKFEFRGRFTGLKDKNGKEVYDGDIVEFTDEFDRESVGQIKFSEEYISFYVFDTSNDWNFIKDCPQDMTLEVIGNIYQNKELLK